MKVVAYGGGTNSTALLLGMFENGIKPDLILFADTGGEKPHTYEHLKWMDAWCIANGFPPIKTVTKRGKRTLGETLEQNCLRCKMLPSIAYGFKSCSQKYKIQPQDMYVNRLPQAKAIWKDGGKVEKYIGYDADEHRRAKITENDKYRFNYPLIEWNMGREECVDIIKRHGIPLPGKSACFFCPSSKKREIIELRQKYPDLMKRALAMEENANLTTVKGLGRSFSWGEFLDAHDQQMDMFIETKIEEPCGCYDGEYA